MKSLISDTKPKEKIWPHNGSVTGVKPGTINIQMYVQIPDALLTNEHINNGNVVIVKNGMMTTEIDVAGVVL
jgi:hypothetical protein